jgi:hypothetical protein
MEQALTDPTLPLTVRDAVDMLLAELADEELAAIRSTPHEDLILHHFGIGLLIRQSLVMHDNAALLADSGTTNPDDASMALVHALWRRLRH